MTDILGQVLRKIQLTTTNLPPAMKKRYQIKTTAYDKRGRILAQAVNDYEKSHPWQKELSTRVGLSEKRSHLHSEVACLLRARGKPVHTLVIERYDALGNPKIAFPCESCQLAIKECKVKVVVFTTEEGFKRYYP